MNRRLCRIAILSMSAAAIVGLAEPGTAQARAQAAAPLLTAFTSSPQTEPPGYCTPEEEGQVKQGPDGQWYECTEVGG